MIYIENGDIVQVLSIWDSHIIICKAKVLYSPSGHGDYWIFEDCNNGDIWQISASEPITIKKIITNNTK